MEQSRREHSLPIRNYHKVAGPVTYDFTTKGNSIPAKGASHKKAQKSPNVFISGPISGRSCSPVDCDTPVHMISLFPAEVERRFAVLGIPHRFTEAEIAEFATIPIVAANVEMIAFPTPQAKRGLNLLTLRKILGTNPQKPPSFFDHPWYLNEAFAEQDCEAGWHFLYTSVLPDSISQPVHYIDSLGNSGLQLPSAIEVVLMLFLHFVGTGEQLLQKKHTWCRDRASLNRFVTVGAFGRNGLFLSAHPAMYASRGLGICARVTR